VQESSINLKFTSRNHFIIFNFKRLVEATTKNVKKKKRIKKTKIWLYV